MPPRLAGLSGWADQQA